MTVTVLIPMSRWSATAGRVGPPGPGEGIRFSPATRKRGCRRSVPQAAGRIRVGPLGQTLRRPEGRLFALPGSLL